MVRIIMDSKLHKFQKIQSGSLKIKRLKYYIALYGVGFYLWVSDLWNILLTKFKYLDEKSEGWFYRFFIDDTPLKIYPVLNLIDTIGMIIFFVFIIYVIVWMYADTYCKLANGEETLPFKNLFLKAVIFNFITYLILLVVSILYIYG